MMKQQPRLLFVLIALLMGCSKPASEQGSDRPPVANEQPDMIITLTDNSTHNIKDLTGKNILVFFQPDCDHCQREAVDFQKNLEAFGACTLYFLTAAPMAEIDQFAREYKLNDRPNIHFGSTPSKNILDNFGPIAAPSIYIYSEEHKLIKFFNGEVAVDRLMEYI